MRALRWLGVAWLAVLLVSPAAAGENPPGLSRGQTVYVPAYSHIYAGNREQPLLLTVTVSIRNIDVGSAVTVDAVDYYDSKGKLLKRHVSKPVVLGPLETVRYVVPRADKAGGSGANFLVVWRSEKPANPLLVEAIMVDVEGQQGISFTSRGVVTATSN
ncbi:MAG: DUF3124 domain-containing protein [Thermodesulfobacteriota bacterium]